MFPARYNFNETDRRCGPLSRPLEELEVLNHECKQDEERESLLAHIRRIEGERVTNLKELVF
jgi:hypothetical protein